MSVWVRFLLLLPVGGMILACAPVNVAGGAAVAPRSTSSVVAACPQPLIAQARWLMNNVARVRFGTTKLEVLAILGQPARAESFLLSDGSMVEVLFYHTAATVCRRSDLDAGLLPFVFGSGRLMGYGQSYYQNFIVPSLRQPLGVMPSVGRGGYVPAPSSVPVATSFPSSLASGYAGRPKMLQEDLPDGNESSYSSVGKGEPLGER